MKCASVIVYLRARGFGLAKEGSHVSTDRLGLVQARVGSLAGLAILIQFHLALGTCRARVGAEREKEEVKEEQRSNGKRESSSPARE